MWLSWFAVAAQACLARGWPQWCVPGGENDAGADSSSSSASSSSSSSSDHDGKVEQPEGHEEQRDEQDQPARDHQIERASIQAELADSFRQVHSRVRWYGNHEHEYNDLEETAKKANLPFKPYQQQTPEERDATEKTLLTWCMQKAEKSV